ncbi:MAG: ATP-dependent helicase, partial [Candidatus Hinthialibacter sp.]
NEQQEQAARFRHGTALVIAVPGSGKTLTMTQRIVYLVQKQGVAPERILGLTFTRSAAQAMRERLAPGLQAQSERVWLTTIHSFCHSLLRKEGKLYAILQGREQIQLLRDILQAHQYSGLSLGMVMQEISLAKNHLLSVEEYQAMHAGDPAMQQTAEVFAAYERQKQQKMFLDFDDLLLSAYTLLSENLDLRRRYHERYPHLLVDEFQDTNPAQMEVLKLLFASSPESSLWVCGDDWQSIYAFNGASLGNILHFEETFPGARKFILHQNYRSTPQILETCQNLIRHNQRKIEKILTTENPDGEGVIVLECLSEEDEALQIGREINDLVDRQGYDHQDIAVLYRVHFQSRPLEEHFSQAKIPYHIENGQNFYQRREIQGLLDYLRLIHNPDSHAGNEVLPRIINVPNRYVGRKFVRELEAYALDQHVSLYAALKSIPIPIPYLRKSIQRFAALIESLRDDVDVLTPVELIHALRECLDYDRWVSEDEIPRPDDGRIANLNQLELAAARFDDLDEFLKHTESFQDESFGHDERGVRLMTIHKSKGLEFPIVFVVGWVEGILPTKRGDLEEERRIGFVGVSRAMQLLYLSYSHTYLGQKASKSIFLEEMLSSIQDKPKEAAHHAV